MSGRLQTFQKAAMVATLMALVLVAFAPRAFAQSMTDFRVRIENISGNTGLPTPFSPGVWATHDQPDPLFTAGSPDRDDGLEAIAEDGDPSMLATALMTQAGIDASGVFNTPVGAGSPGPIMPGEAYEFDVSADPDNPTLSLATMFVQSNDVIVAPDGMGIPLFDGNGAPLTGDVTDQLALWDVGTEVNEAPGLGPNQAPRQPAPDTGPTEGGVYPFTNTTRSLPIASGIGDITVTASGPTFTITVANDSANRGAIDTPLSPLFFAVHNESWSLFTPGSPDFGNGLEALAEDGMPDELVTSYMGTPGLHEVGSVGTMGIMTGEQFEFSLTPTAAYAYLTIATMVVQSNDAFLAFGPEGVALLDINGVPRPVADINADIARTLAVWDVGTEANEVPGVGPNQAMQQSAPNTGPADPDNTVRRYDDSTNDLAGALLGGLIDLEITNQGGTDFEVVLTNTSGDTAYPAINTPMVWALHDESVSLFEVGEPASPGLEDVAEDGAPDVLAAALSGAAGVSDSGVANMPDGGPPGPLMPGQSYTAEITADAAHRYLSITSMVVPSNDTFLAFGPEGIALLNTDGSPRSDSEIEADVLSMLAAWESGTERNQAGAAGPDQAPYQAAPDTGADEGSGLVRLLNDPVWSYPALSDVVRVTVEIPPPTAVTIASTSSTSNVLHPALLAAAALGLIVTVGVVVRRRR